VETNDCLLRQNAEVVKDQVKLGFLGGGLDAVYGDDRQRLASGLDLGQEAVIMKMKPLKLFFLVVALGMSVVAGRSQTQGHLVKLDPTFDKIVSSNAQVEKIADGFGIVEGPVWVREGGYLLFSDIPANVINKWTPDGKVSVFLKTSGFTGAIASGVGGEADKGATLPYPMIGSNAVTLDRQGRVVFCAQGDRAIVRVEKNAERTVLVDRYQGKRLNSPNDLLYKSDGSLYFTDPTSGLRLKDDDPNRELPFSGLFLLKEGKLRLVYQDFAHPNGLALSPDEKHFYLNDSGKKIIMRFDVQPDDTLANGQLFIDMSGDQAVGGPDGMKVDENGNVYCTGPGGLWIMSPEGKHLGTVLTPQRLTNLTFGDADGKTLYMTDRTALFRIRLNVEGIRP
jgi:gluconolactonase